MKFLSWSVIALPLVGGLMYACNQQEETLLSAERGQPLGESQPNSTAIQFHRLPFYNPSAGAVAYTIEGFISFDFHGVVISGTAKATFDSLNNLIEIWGDDQMSDDLEDGFPNEFAGGISGLNPGQPDEPLSACSDAIAQRVSGCVSDAHQLGSGAPGTPNAMLVQDMVAQCRKDGLLLAAQQALNEAACLWGWVCDPGCVI